MDTVNVYRFSQSTLDKVRSEYEVAFEQAKPCRLNFYVYLEQAHGIVNVVVEGYGFDWQYQATFDTKKSASAFLLKWS